MSNTKIINPTKPSECVAAVSLSTEDGDHPYLSLFYTVVEGAIHFFGLPVVGTDHNQDGDVFLVYENGVEPDDTTPLMQGIVLANGTVHIDTPDEYVVLPTEDDALNFVAILRAVRQMSDQINERA